jgi:phage-related protein
MDKRTKIPTSKKRIHAIFYASDSGNEPVKELLLELGRPIKTIVGEDIRFVELNWRVDRPYVDRLRSGHGEFEETLYEVRHTVNDIEYRTLFFVSANLMVLVHFFKKTSQKTPKSELDLGWERMKKWVRTQREIEIAIKKGKKSHGQKK